MGEWRTVPLAELVDPQRSISYGIVQPGAPTADGVPIVRVSDVRDGRIATDEPLRVAREVEASFGRTRLRGGELLLTLVGTVGEAAIVPNSMAGWNTARAVAVIPVRSEIGAYWVSLALRSPAIRSLIDSRVNTTVQVTLNLKDVAQLPIPLPPEDLRKAITSIIGALDEKIELNRRMNETLEAMARALFKSWFIDFDPVRAKVQNENRDTTPQVMDLFPASVERSELGEISQGWRVDTLSLIGSISKETANPLDLPDVAFQHFSIPAYDDGQAARFEFGIDIKSQKFRVSPDAVLLSKLNPEIDRVWLVDVEASSISVCSTEFLVFQPVKPCTRAFLYCLMRSDQFRNQLMSFVTGTSKSHQRARPETVLATKVLVPPAPLFAAFHKLAMPLLDKVRINRRQSRTLAELRDTLLPKLISGELRIKDAERFVGAAV